MSVHDPLTYLFVFLVDSNLSYSIGLLMKCFEPLTFRLKLVFRMFRIINVIHLFHQNIVLLGNFEETV